MQCIAYYLGQFHPTSENNDFWGEGFTEWHNVARSRPLYPGHQQPILPGSLGFYDLRCDDTLKEQINLAKEIGVDAFCHWHYWFAGRRLLHKPLDRMIAIDKGFKFVLGWANESWTGIWHGDVNRLLIEQRYDQIELKNHAKLISSYIDTGSYLQCNGKIPFVIYKPRQIPDPINYLSMFREEVRRNCGAELYIIGNWSPGRSGEISDPSSYGLDAVVITPVAKRYRYRVVQDVYSAGWQVMRRFGMGPEIRSYKHTASTQRSAKKEIMGVSHSTVVTGWDNTPRSGRRGLVLKDYNEATFRQVAESAIKEEIINSDRLLFVKSWNEWAEGNVLEPIFNGKWSPAAILRELLSEYRSEVTSLEVEKTCGKHGWNQS